MTQREVTDLKVGKKKKGFFAGSARIPACWTRSVQKASTRQFKLIQDGGFYAAKRDVARRDACAPSEELFTEALQK